MNFDFLNTTRIIFDSSSFQQLPELIQQYGRRCLFITGKRNLTETGLLTRIESQLIKNLTMHSEISQAGEPKVSEIDLAVNQARDFKPDVIVAIGGGSVLDLGKALSALITNEGTIVDYLEGVGIGKQITNPTVPFIAVPTTSGTGSEMTRNAVITGDNRNFKKSIRSPLLLPEIALIDPDLTHLLPPDLTASCGFDAISQLVESYTSNNANAFTDGLCEKALQYAAGSFFETWENGLNAKAREGMAYASMISGITLANAGLGAIHGLASPLGAFFPIPHGLVCALLLPHVVEANIKAIDMREKENTQTIEKYSTVAKIWCKDTDDPMAFVEEIHSLHQKINLPKMNNFGITEDDIPKIVANSRGSSMKYNPIELTDKELTEIMMKVI